ncbi:MAG: (5-formylfuran-3-yl)methyl phosphate synthase [Methylobacillus sp.]|jgi:uncharacterized protein (UPF0264 family)|nr:(5-formylfuran-3-yl)methyl phosphate synthase [Methylobacillus sp.]
MSRLLVSVCDVEEARIALECDADIIDLKNPAAGALGALPPETLREIVNVVAGRKPVSATIGDLPMIPEQLAAAARVTAETGVDIVKIGFFGHAGHETCIAALQALATDGIRLVAVLFADQRPDLKSATRFAHAGFYGVMLDTAAKNGQGLRHYLSDAALGAFVAESQTHGLLAGLAGSLTIADLDALLPLQADYLGFRGALCANASRTARLERARLLRLQNALRVRAEISEVVTD